MQAQRYVNIRKNMCISLCHLNGCITLCQIAEIYDFDATTYFVRDPQKKPGATGVGAEKAATRPRWAPTETIFVPLNELVGVSYKLSHVDVLSNLGDDTICDRCKRHIVGSSVIQCDGCNPVIAAVRFPSGLTGMGRQMKCHKGFLCVPCDEDLGRKAEWHCSSCMKGQCSYFENWGHNIDEPGILRAPGTVSAMCLPSNYWTYGPGTMPSEVYLREVSDRQLRRHNATQRLSRSGGEQAVQAACVILRFFRMHFLSRRNQERVLSVVNALADSGILTLRGTENLDDVDRCQLPRTLKCLEARAASVVVSPKDIEVSAVRLSISDLRQLKTEVTVHRSNPAKVLQDLILEAGFPDGSFNLTFGGAKRSQYCDQDGVEVFGFEAYHGSRWQQLKATVPNDTVVLGVTVWSDGVASQGRGLHPIMVSVNNFPRSLRGGPNGTALLATSTKIPIRKPRGSDHNEKLDPEQKRLHKTLKSVLATLCLAELDGLCQAPVDFMYRLKDGSLSKRRTQVRVIAYSADMAEKDDFIAVGKEDCHVCYGYSNATGSGQGGPGSPNRPHMSLDSDRYCGTALRRTVQETSARQGHCMKIARSHGVTAATAEAIRLGVRYDVPCFMERLDSAFPWHAGGVCASLGYDRLHNMLTGLYPRFIILLDEMFLQNHRSTAELQSPEDVRNYTDMVVSSAGPRQGSPAYDSGFYACKNVGGLKGHDVKSIVELLPLAYMGNDDLLPNKAMRERTLRLHYALLRVTGTMSTEQFTSDDELRSLDTAIRNDIIKELHWMMDTLGEEKCKGHGFDLSKVHALGDIVRTMRDFGSVAIVDSNDGERSVKKTKEAHAHVHAVSEEDSDLSLMQNVGALHADAGLASGADRQKSSSTSASVAVRTARPNFVQTVSMDVASRIGIGAVFTRTYRPRKR